ncbi:hypothetical protein [Falsibacillus pallidus]|uniref:hypothetical protein n=1 Tax=Falsibacillus pallidus TaxID=493781 RepID=UPI003D9849FB
MKKIVAVITFGFLIILGLFLYFSSIPLITDSYDQITIKEMNGSEKIISDSATIDSIVQSINQHPRRLALFHSNFEDDSEKHSLVKFQKGKKHIMMDYVPSKGILYYGRWKIHYLKYAFSPLK